MIKICTVHYCGLSNITRKSIDNLQGKLDFFHVMAESTYISEGRNTAILGKRNSLIHPKLEDKYSHYLMLDSDIGFTPEQLQMLLSAKVPVISGLYKARQGSSAVAGFFGLAEGNLGRALSMSDTGVQKVGWCGAGFLLVERQVFEKMEYPWFQHRMVNYMENETPHCIQTGEDIGFCMGAKLAGFDVMVHCDCKVEHVTNKREAYNKKGGLMAEEVGFDQFSAYLKGKVDVAKQAIDAVFADCMRNIAQLAEENDKLKKEPKEE